MKYIINMKYLFALVFCTTLTVGIGAGEAVTDKVQSVKAPVTLQSLQMKANGVDSELVIAASVPPTYTSYKTSAPNRLVVDFSQAIQADSLKDMNFNKGPVKGVTLKRFDTDAGVLTRMEIFLTQDVDPIITPSTDKIGELRISFPGFKPEAVISSEKQETTPAVQTAVAPVPVQPAEPAKEVVTGVIKGAVEPVITDVAARADGIVIVAQQPIVDYKTFRLNKPERVVVDVINAKLNMSDKLIQLNTAGVSTARVGSYPDKVRVVFDSISGSLPDASFDKTSSGLMVSFGAQNAGKERKESAVYAQSAQPKAAAVAVEPASHGTAQVAALDFQVLGDISRITVKLAGSPQVEDPVKSAGTVSFRIKNAQLPRNLQRSLEAREFASPVLRITPVQVKTKTGNDTLVRVALKMDSPYELRREADLVYLDIKHPIILSKQASEPVKAATAQKAAPKNEAPQDSKEQQLEKSVLSLNGKDAKTKTYTGRRVSLEFADAEVRSIFQLLSEVSGKNFVLGDEIGGKISLKLVNVPWDQAFDVILTTKGFESQEQDNVLVVRGAGKLKSDLDSAAEKRAAQMKSGRMITRKFSINYSNSEDVAAVLKPLVRYEWQGSVTSDKRTNTVIVNAVEQLIGDMEDLVKSIDVPERQVMIEARIIEASSDFSRSLGVSWGLNSNAPSGSGGKDWPFINSLSSVFGGIASVPGATSVGSTTGAADINFGTIGANVRLSMRLNAAAKAGLIRIISSPKVATLNNKSAKITQGKQIPYTTSTSDKIETKFVEAALSLEVTPHINNNGTIILKIDAKNDSPDTTSSSATPPINKKQATTEMLLRDGETTIIGGIFVDSETEGDEGLPWLMDIPILGNLFKTKSYSKNKSELLIFITPKILNTYI